MAALTFAAMLDASAFGDEATTNHSEFEADALAKRDVSSLLVDAMWSQKQWFGTGAPRKRTIAARTSRLS